MNIIADLVQVSTRMTAKTMNPNTRRYNKSDGDHNENNGKNNKSSNVE